MESTAEGIYTENTIYVVHQDNVESYLSGKYDIEETFNKETLRLESVYFHHSQRVKIPAELFTEDKGVISFTYYAMHYVNNKFPSSGGPVLEMSYQKKRGKIYLDQTEFYCAGLRVGKIKVKNLETD